MTFKLTLREDRPATIEEHRALRQQILRLQTALKAARILIKQIEDALNRAES